MRGPAFVDCHWKWQWNGPSLLGSLPPTEITEAHRDSIQCEQSHSGSGQTHVPRPQINMAPHTVGVQSDTKQVTFSSNVSNLCEHITTQKIPEVRQACDQGLNLPREAIIFPGPKSLWGKWKRSMDSVTAPTKEVVFTPTYWMLVQLLQLKKLSTDFCETFVEGWVKSSSRSRNYLNDFLPLRDCSTTLGHFSISLSMSSNSDQKIRDDWISVGAIWTRSG